MTRSSALLAVVFMAAIAPAHAQDRTPPAKSTNALQPPIDSKKSAPGMGSLAGQKPAMGAGTGENKQTPTGGQPGGGAGKS